MWINTETEFLNLNKIFCICSYDHERLCGEEKDTTYYIYYFLDYKEHQKWMEEDDYFPYYYSPFFTEDEREKKYEEIKAMLIKKPRVELF